MLLCYKKGFDSIWVKAMPYVCLLISAIAFLYDIFYLHGFIENIIHEKNYIPIVFFIIPIFEILYWLVCMFRDNSKYAKKPTRTKNTTIYSLIYSFLTGMATALIEMSQIMILGGLLIIGYEVAAYLWFFLSFALTIPIYICIRKTAQIKIFYLIGAVVTTLGYAIILLFFDIFGGDKLGFGEGLAFAFHFYYIVGELGVIFIADLISILVNTVICKTNCSSRKI